MVAPTALFSDEVVAVAHEADLFVLNLECAISDRGAPWPDPAKPFFFRAPPVAVDVLRHLGVRCVSLANNHALDFGAEALLDTFGHLAGAGISWVGAGAAESAARAPIVLQSAGLRVGVVAVTDHPADVRRRCRPPWCRLRRPPPRLTAMAARHHQRARHRRRAGDTPLGAEHGRRPRTATSGLLLLPSEAPEPPSSPATPPTCSTGSRTRSHYDLGDFIDDYATDPDLRNDLGLLFLVTFDDRGRPTRLEAIPLALDYCYTRLAAPTEADWIIGRFRRACTALGTDVEQRGGRLVIEWRPPTSPTQSTINGGETR